MKYPDIGMIELLIKEGIDIHTIDNYGKNAFMIANEKNYSNIVDLLKKAGAL